MGIFSLFVKGSYRNLSVKVYICGLLALASMVLMVVNIGFLYPKITGMINEDNQALIKEKDQVEALRSFAASHENLEEFQQTITKEYELVQSLLPDNADIGCFMGEVEEFAEKNAVEIVEFKPKVKNKPKNQKNTEETPIEIKLRGDYYAIMAFVRDLQQGKRAVQFSEMKLKYTPQGLECQIDVYIFNLSTTK